MANRRMIHNKISRSEQVNNLSNEAALLFTWMITHADDEGKLKGSSASIRATVLPMKELKNDDVEKLLQEIVGQGLIYRWSDEFGIYIEFPTWFKHQTLQRDRIKDSIFPSYNEHDSAMEAGGLQNDSSLETQDNSTQDNQTELNQIQSKEIELTVREREYERKPPLEISESPLQGLGEQTAIWACKSLDHSNLDLLDSRYREPIRLGVSSSKIQMLVHDILKDIIIIDKGLEFEKRIKAYLPKNKQHFYVKKK